MRKPKGIAQAAADRRQKFLDSLIARLRDESTRMAHVEVSGESDPIELSVCAPLDEPPKSALRKLTITITYL